MNWREIDNIKVGRLIYCKIHCLIGFEFKIVSKTFANARFYSVKMFIAIS